MKRPPVPPTVGRASVEIGSPTAVEKGSMTRTVVKEVGAVLYNLARRNSSDSRSSTWASLMPLADMMSLHRTATLTPSLVVRVPGKTPTQTIAGGVQARTLYTHVVQVANHLRADLLLPEIFERVAKAERSKLFRSKVCLRSPRLDPGVDARASDETRFGAKAIVKVLGLDR
jgi:hypothetical protein